MQVFMENFNVCGSKKDHLSQLQKCLEKCKWNGINHNLEKFTLYINSCRNPNLGLTTKANACKVAGQEESLESCRMFLGVQESVRE
jgi:hypothetical protein